MCSKRHHRDDETCRVDVIELIAKMIIREVCPHIMKDEVAKESGEMNEEVELRN